MGTVARAVSLLALLSSRRWDVCDKLPSSFRRERKMYQITLSEAGMLKM